MAECNRSAIESEMSDAVRKDDLLQLDYEPCPGCHGHGFAWPCLRNDKSTATQSCDRGTLKTSDFFPDRLSVAEGRFRAEQVVVVLGEAVRFVAHILEQSQRERMLAEQLRLGLARQKDLFLTLGQ